MTMSGMLRRLLVALALLGWIEAAQAATNQWTPAASMTTARWFPTATLLRSGKVLVAGGSGGIAELASAELYDSATNSWSAAGSMATTRRSHTATLLPSGKVLVTGGAYFGIGYGVYLASAELYDPATNSWSAAGALATARSYHTATLLPSGKVLVVGGANYNDSGQFYLASAELYDPATNGWSAAGSLVSGRHDHTATLLPSGKVLVAGGLGPNATYLASAELYDPATNSWSAARSPAIARVNHTATLLLPSGNVLVAGGFNSTGNLSSAEVYDPARNSWSAAGALGTARGEHTATLLPSGRVLVAGGFNVIANLTDVELFDPTTNSWSSTGSLATGRTGNTATLLSSGEVLVAGGFCCGSGLASAETYAEATPVPTTLNQWGIGGTWYNPLTSGQGFVINVLPDYAGAGHGLMFGGWFTFDTTGSGGEDKQRWYTLQGAVDNSTSASLTIYSTQGGNFSAPPIVSAQQVGSASIVLIDCAHGSLSFAFFDGSSRKGNIPITRLGNNVGCGAGDTGAAAGTNALLSGAWYNPATSGQGILLNVVPSQNALFAAWYTYTANGGAVGGPASERWYTLQAVLSTPISAGKPVSGVQVFSTSGGIFDDPTKTTINQVGTATLTFINCNTMEMAYTFNGGGNNGLSGTLHLSRIGPAQAACVF